MDTPPDKNQLAIDAKGLVKTFGSARALAGFDWQVPAGTISGLVGPNGAGKTTAYSVIAGFLKATAGRVSVLGRAPSALGALAGEVSILPQDATFDVNVPLLEQLRFLGRLGGLDAGEAEREAGEALARVGLSAARYQSAATLSHGMFKRFGIAQAFIGRPSLVLLDEPTAGLDPENAYQVREIVRGLRGRATVVVSSHNLAEIQDLCDHLCVMRAGATIAQGPTADLVGAGELLVVGLARPSPGLVDKLGAIDGVSSVTPDAAATRLSIRYDGAKNPPDDLTRAVLEAILAERAPLVALSRGASLETRFLEMTR